MHQSDISRSETLRTPVARPVHLETFLSNGLQDCFYTGFSGRIRDGGIFLTTWKSMEKYTPVEVAIHFPDGQTIHPRGTVEWIRDANPAIKDMAPGIGVSFVELSAFDNDIIEYWLLSHPPVFLDNIEIPPAPASNTSISDNIELETLPLNLGPACDLDAEQLFLAGIARDVTHYLNERPLSLLRQRIDRENRALQERVNTTWTLRMLPPRRNENFLGGFQQNDHAHRLFVCTNSPLSIGATLRLQLICENGTQLGCMGEVRWVRRANPLVDPFSAPAGMGVIMKNLKESTWQSLGKESGGMIICETIREPDGVFDS